jgi:heme/copper-type cytochrome/quinol oxidase subunit 3
VIGVGSNSAEYLVGFLGVDFSLFFARFGTHDLHVYTGLVGLDAPFWTVFRRVLTRSFHRLRG